nr:hypothetical protein BaRGS_018567 [Batillaria attramentaria]
MDIAAPVPNSGGITNMSDKMRCVVVLLLVALATANPVDKRFLGRIVDAFRNAWNSAKSEFDKLTAGINVDLNSVVNKLIPLIDSAPTEIASP